MPMDWHNAWHHAKPAHPTEPLGGERSEVNAAPCEVNTAFRGDPLDLERAAFWQELARAVAILGPIVALTEIGVWLLW